MFFQYCKNVKMISTYNLAYIVKRIKIFLKIFIISIFSFVYVKVWNKTQKSVRNSDLLYFMLPFLFAYLFLFLYFIYCTFILGLRLFCTYPIIMPHKTFFSLSLSSFMFTGCYTRIIPLIAFVVTPVFL